MPNVEEKQRKKQHKPTDPRKADRKTMKVEEGNILANAPEPVCKKREKGIRKKTCP